MKIINCILILCTLTLMSCSFLTTHNKKTLNKQETLSQVNTHINEYSSSHDKTVLIPRSLTAIKASGIAVNRQDSEYKFIIPSDRFFKINSDKLLTPTNVGLDKIADFMAAMETAPILITGHSDHIGANKYKKELSLAQANRIKAYLWTCGIKQERISTQGLADYYPVTQRNMATSSINRRVVIEIKVPKN